MRNVFGVALSALLFCASAQAATITVNSTADENSSSSPNGTCTLREAVIAANTDTAVDGCPAGSGADTIVLAAGIYTLTIAGTDELFSETGDLNVTDDLVIRGAGAALTRVDGGGLDRVFLVAGLPTLTLEDLSVRGGVAPTGSNGGGVFHNGAGTLTLRNCAVYGNSAFNGGGIENSGTMVLENVTISENDAGERGGGIFHWSSPLTIINSTIQGNSAVTGGGGIDVAGSSATVDIRGTTINGNVATNIGGGVFVYNGTVTLSNSTVSGNSAEFGGGFGITNGTLRLFNVSAVGNTGTSNGGGMQIQGGAVEIGNTILGPNNVPPGQAPDCYGPLTSRGYNLLGNDTGCTFTAATGDQVGTGASPIDPLLATLADNGGPTYTHALLAGSPAIDAGNPAGCTWDHDNDPGTAEVALTHDQRSAPRVADGDGVGGTRCDIGAYERWVAAYQSPSFADVTAGHFAFAHIESLNASGITAGCGGGNYCPATSVTRAQMAVFLERGMRGAAYTPPPASGTVFNDVSAGSFAAAWIEQLAADGITSGCGGGNYCPATAVNRAQMAVFLLRAKHGAGYTPPACTGTMFADVSAAHPFCAWIEQLAAEAITSGCGGGNYCPATAVNRAQMAIFLQRAFNLALPQP